MTTVITDLEENQLKEHLLTGGFLSAFTDIYGDAQPAPITQMLELDLTDIDKDDRAVMIRNVGNVNNPSTNTLFTQRNMVIVLVGNTSAADSAIMKGLAVDMETWLKANVTDGECIFNITSSGVAGPFIFDDSRRAYEINLLVGFNILRPF
tara:strand:- start:1585 stop:2037 length:453 start_codon:yes stop_codon:yes gene_type:complete